MFLLTFLSMCLLMTVFFKKLGVWSVLILPSEVIYSEQICCTWVGMMFLGIAVSPAADIMDDYINYFSLSILYRGEILSFLLVA